MFQPSNADFLYAKQMLDQRTLCELLGDLTAELASAIAGRCKATEVRQSLRTYDANYKTVPRLAQPQVKFHFGALCD
jgi:hypothetical protein